MNSPDLPGGAKRAALTRKTSTTAPAPAKRRTAPRVKSVTGSAISIEERRRMVEVCAYFLAERRGFAPGNDQQDWLEAEACIESMLAQSARKARSKRTTQ